MDRSDEIIWASFSSDKWEAASRGLTRTRWLAWCTGALVFATASGAIRVYVHSPSQIHLHAMALICAVYLAWLMELLLRRKATKSLDLRGRSPRLSASNIACLVRKGRVVSNRILYRATSIADRSDVSVVMKSLDHPDLNRAGPAVWNALS